MIEHKTACEGIRTAGHAPESSIERGRNRRPAPAWLPRVLLVAFVFVFFWDSFLAGKAPLMRDTFADFMPWRMFGREAFRAATLPLWNPYSHAGQPFIANPQTAFFYPPHILFYLLPPVIALKLWLAFHLSVAAVSMHSLARQWRMGMAASLLAAVSFAFSACMIATMEFQSLFGVYAWVPLGLLLTSRLVEAWERNRHSGSKTVILEMLPTTLGLALVFALQFLSGYPECFFYSLLIDALFIVFACLSRFDWKGLAACGGGFAAAGALCLGLCMVQLLPTLQLIPFSVRGGGEDPGLGIASLHPRLLMSWLMPFIGGHPGHIDQWWGYPRLTMNEFWLCANYIGLAPLMLASLAPLAMPRGRRRMATLFLLAIAAAGIVMAMGAHTPIFMWCNRHIPLLGLFRWPAKYAQIAVFALPLLAGFGLHALLERRGAGRAMLAILLLWFAIWAVMAIVWIGYRNSPDFVAWLTGGAFIYVKDHPAPLERFGCDLGWSVAMLGCSWLALVLLAAHEIPERARRAIAAFVVLLAFADLYVVGRQIHPTAPDDVYRAQSTELIVAQADSEPGRFWTPYNNQEFLYGSGDTKFFDQARRSGVGESSLSGHVFKTCGGETLRISDYEDFTDLLVFSRPGDSTWERVANLVNMRYFVQTAPMDQIMAGVAPLDVRIVKRGEALPRALVAGSWSLQLGLKETLNRLVADDFDAYRAIIVDRVPDGWPAYQPVAENSSHAPITRLDDAGIDQIEYGWNRVDITARSPGRALLMLNDVYYPGWRATVDGREVPILRANLVFRAIPLDSAGAHSVSFTYRPPQVAAGMVISLLTGMVMIGLVVVTRRRDRASRINSAASAAGARQR